MLTIALGQICYYIAYSWNDFTGGYDGLRGFQRQPIGPIDIQGNGFAFYYFVLFVFAVCGWADGPAAALAVRAHA